MFSEQKKETRNCLFGLNLSFSVTGAVEVYDLVPGHLVPLPALVAGGEGEGGGGVDRGGDGVAVRGVSVGEGQVVVVPGGGGGGRGVLSAGLRDQRRSGAGRLLRDLSPHLGAATDGSLHIAQRESLD